MGTDHKGPLVAFVVIAVLAAAILITTVRSQAAPDNHLSHQRAHSDAPVNLRPA